jgi:hypothetical protein
MWYSRFMKWKQPPAIKIYEALGAVADKRVEIEGNSGKVFSSSRNKFYEVTYDPAIHAIMANDNGSFWKGYLGYPAIAFMMRKGIISYEAELGDLLKGIAWKDINKKFKNDFDKTLGCVLKSKTKEDRSKLVSFIGKIDAEIRDLSLDILGTKQRPPDGY